MQLSELTATGRRRGWAACTHALPARSPPFSIPSRSRSRESFGAIRAGRMFHVEKADERREIIAYLKQISGKQRRRFDGCRIFLRFLRTP
jgi:hypothetical protein